MVGMVLVAVVGGGNVDVFVGVFLVLGADELVGVEKY